MLKLFVAVLPPADVVELIAAPARPEAPGVRWVPPEKFHITLRFLGAPTGTEAEVTEALATARLPQAQVRLGPGVRRLGRGALVVTAHGLDRLAAATAAATRAFEEPRPDRRYRGHLTVARLKDVGPPTGFDYKHPPVLSFDVTEVALVQSHPAGTYTKLARFALHDTPAEASPQ